jgi:hypothetical protein
MDLVDFGGLEIGVAALPADDVEDNDEGEDT